MNKHTIFMICSLVTLLMLAACSNETRSIKSDVSNHTVVPDKTVEHVYKVVIDPGHGGEDPGATAVSGKYEKDFTLRISQEITRQLKQDPQIEVFMTSDSCRN